MKDTPQLILITVSVIVIILCGFAFTDANRDCRAKGGIYMRGAFGYVCMKGEVLK